MPKEAKTIEKKSAKSTKTEIKTDVYNVKGEKVGKITLPESVFGAKINPDLISQAVRVFMENQRQGTRKSKSRGEVTGSSRKLFRQKGTGRARAGDIKSPIQVGGGIVHGPRVKDFHLNMSQKMKRAALYNALSNKFQADKIRIINNLDKFPPKTKNMVEFLENLKVAGNTILVTDKVNKEIKLAGRNLQHVEIRQVSQLNTYEVMQCKNLLLLKDALTYFTVKKERTERIVEKPKTRNKIN